MVAVDIRNLTKRFGSVTALNNVSLRIEPGELFFLLGPSGCGKTTLLRAIAGFYQPDQGTISFDDQDVTFTPPHARNTAMMFQSYALWPHMSVAKNVAFGLEERQVPKPQIEERVLKALEMVKMRDYTLRKINQLSGGQQQRVALARALVVRPRCLLLDEPLSNLDARLRLEMRSEIRRICKQFGLTAIYVTHDQKEALSMADRLAVLEAGRISQVGTPEEIYRNPISRQVADFIGETNLIEATLMDPVDEHHHRVSTEFGEFIGHFPASSPFVPREGAPVVLSIRPECLELDHNGDSSAQAQNCIRGRLEDALYLGELAQYILRTDSEPSTIHISELNPAHLKGGNETPISATARQEDVVILPR